MCVTRTGDVLCVGSKMGGRVWHGEIHRASRSPDNPREPTPDDCVSITPVTRIR